MTWLDVPGRKAVPTAEDLAQKLAAIERRRGPAFPGETAVQYLARVTKTLDERWRDYERRYGLVGKTTERTMQTNSEARRAVERLEAKAAEVTRRIRGCRRSTHT